METENGYVRVDMTISLNITSYLKRSFIIPILKKRNKEKGLAHLVARM